MQVKIYFNDKAVYLCDELTDELKELLHHPDAIFIDELSTSAINALLHEIKKDDFHAGVLFYKDLEILRKSFFKHFTAIEAAGGIVQNLKKEIMFIYRLEKWDLPKGKIEAGETPEIAAEREIKEETGIKDIEIGKKIGKTYHTYEAYGKHFIKTTHWFHFNSKHAELLKPQLEEDITMIKWFSTREIKTPLQNTYASVSDILSNFFDSP